MALVPIVLDMFRHAASRLEAHGCKSRRVLALGYPDILASPQQIGTLFGQAVVDRLAYRTDSPEILRWHGATMTDRVVEAGSLFAALGFELEVIDIAVIRGKEIIQDLNEPVPEGLRERYAVVIDPGTLEHCFNVAQAAKNLATMVALGGVAIQGNPLNMYNHGFYNFSPTWYHDFYTTNGFKLENLVLLAESKEKLPIMGDVPPVKRFASVPENSTLLALARRTEIVEIRWPTQTKYLKVPAGTAA